MNMIIHIISFFIHYIQGGSTNKDLILYVLPFFDLKEVKKMFNNPYMQNYVTNQPGLTDRIDNQIAQLNQMKEQIKSNQSPAINQTFQLAPNNSMMKFVNTIDDVNKEIVYFDTPFFSKDMSMLWIKNVRGEVKSYELNEIIPKDNKDLQIEYLQAQIEELKGKIENDPNVTNVNAKQNETNSTTNDDGIGKTIKEVEPTSISKVSRSKKE